MQSYRLTRKALMVVLASAMAGQGLVVAAAQEQRSRKTVVASETAETTNPGTADGLWSPALTGVRRPLYRLRPSDIVEIHFTFTPEFDQTATVQPDGFIPLKGAAQLYAQDLTVPELQRAITDTYTGTMHDPEVTVSLKDFDRPYFLAGGQVAHPGKYELREDLTVTEGVELAGGFSDQAKHSQVVLFRHVSPDLVESRVINVKELLRSRNLAEDFHLRSGDMVFVPQNAISKIRRYLPASNLSLYSTPTQF
jgi:polysaccharide export outer membrane protein